MKMYSNGKKGEIIFDVDNGGLTILFKDCYNNVEVLNLNEADLLGTNNSIGINEVIIKNHGEFQGVVDSLISAKIIYSKANKLIELGYVKYGVYVLTPLAIKEIYRQNNLLVAAV